jgi:formylglycine-generating enzyme required for sulfatase activity
MISPNDGVELVYIPEGEFIMGSNSDEPYWWGAESPKHRVFLDAFWIYRAEVTNALYRTCGS